MCVGGGRKGGKFRRVHIKFFFYNSKFNFTAKSLVTNTVVLTRVLCNSKCGLATCFSLTPDRFKVIFSLQFPFVSQFVVSHDMF